jgi:hypothetical protein
MLRNGSTGARRGPEGRGSEEGRELGDAHPTDLQKDGISVASVRLRCFAREAGSNFSPRALDLRLGRRESSTSSRPMYF